MRETDIYDDLRSRSDYHPCPAQPFPVRFRAGHYLPLLVLHLSLLIRISGDLIGSGDVRRWGGMLNGLAILLFLIVTVISVWQGRQHAAVVRETPIDNLPLLD